MNSFFVLAVLAAADSSWGLKWTASPECIEVAELSRSVETKLGHPVFAADAEVRIDGTAESTPEGWRARFTLVNRRNEVLGSRELTSAEPSCRSLDGKLVAVLALMIDSGPPVVPPPVVGTKGISLRFNSGTFVHIDTDNTRVRLLKNKGSITGGTSRGTSITLTEVEDVCGAPCDRTIGDSTAEFSIGGDGVTPSRTFRLDGFQGAVDLKVHAGNSGMRVAGVLCIIFGGASAGLGVAMILFSTPGGALITLIASAALLAVGIPLTVASATDVELNERRKGGLGISLLATPPSNASSVTVGRF